ncbi:hypothetical protein AV530_000905 [Patagioenas fasciata monilis]|uniref:Uncharacterized protein n=1 Tax=Patagioenas fasciata monilis TaxID=372326 RepID=A0A1V4KSM0_PATFA|nr:hypothetical protein AV530_000905 [Patagioenas fasciata monilis]
MHISCDAPFSSPRAQSGGSQPLPGAAAPLAKRRPRAGGAEDRAQQWDRQHRGATEPGGEESLELQEQDAHEV